MRLCYLSRLFDADYDSILADWHVGCDARTDIIDVRTVTTPVEAQLTTTHDEHACTSAFELCASYVGVTESRKSLHRTNAADLSSCQCRSSAVKLRYDCVSVGFTDCEHSTPPPEQGFSVLSEYCGLTDTEWLVKTTGQARTLAGSGAPSKTAVSLSSAGIPTQELRIAFCFLL
jgi:hypothetical protein